MLYACVPSSVVHIARIICYTYAYISAYAYISYFTIITIIIPILSFSPPISYMCLDGPPRPMWSMQ